METYLFESIRDPISFVGLSEDRIRLPFLRGASWPGMSRCCGTCSEASHLLQVDTMPKMLSSFLSQIGKVYRHLQEGWETAQQLVFVQLIRPTEEAEGDPCLFLESKSKWPRFSPQVPDSSCRPLITPTQSLPGNHSPHPAILRDIYFLISKDLYFLKMCSLWQNINHPLVILNCLFTCSCRQI